MMSRQVKLLASLRKGRGVLRTSGGRSVEKGKRGWFWGGIMGEAGVRKTCGVICVGDGQTDGANVQKK